MDKEDGIRVYIDWGRRFQRPYLAIRIGVMTGCRFAVKKCGIQGTMLAAIVGGWCPGEQLISDTGGHPMDLPPQRQGR